MFQTMRRKRQELSREDTAAILERRASGVLALAEEGGFPYAVPLSYVYTGDKLYFHCAKSGHKLDAIQQNGKVSFCVIDQDKIVPEKYTSYFRSVIAFGRVEVIKDEKEKRTAIEKLAVKYAPEDTAVGRKNAIEREWLPLCMLKMSIDHITGKEAVELIKEKE